MVFMSSFPCNDGKMQWRHRWLPKNPAACLARGWLPIAMAGFCMTIAAQTTSPAIKGIALPVTPLYAVMSTEKPALVIAMHLDLKSSEALYTVPGEIDDRYTTAKEYLGYHDAESCYHYNDAPTETPATGQTTADYKRFDRTGPAIHRQCSNAFSGNFLNWATGAAIDMLRLTLTGGDRHIDTPSLTILQRAMLPIGSGGSRTPCDWNRNIFLAKRLSKDGGGANMYWGAVPTSMIAAAYGNDIFVSNMRNRIYFGLSRTVSCNGGAFEQALGHPVRSIGTVSTAPSVPPTTAVRCAAEGQICSFSGIKDVWYGTTGGQWKVAPASVGIQCTGSVFGQMSSSVNECRVTDRTETWTPPNSYSRPVSDITGVLPSGAVRCAGEGQTCSFSGRKEIWYGTGDSWRVAPASDGIHCSHTVFGGQTGETVKSCHRVDYNGSWTPPASLPRPTVSTEYLNSDGYFYARVKVCDTNTAGTLQDVRDYGLCQRYPGGSYKPTGIIQKYGDQLRLAAFGYLLDDGRDFADHTRHGGVLRVPMKYAGNKTYDSNGLDNTPVGGNPAVEWDPGTGVLKSNPLDDASASPPVNVTWSTIPTRGIINFLNKSGRAGPDPGPMEERHRNEGPAGELYYEAIRYLQGLAPSSAAIRGTITERMADGFPYYTVWSDPYGGGRSHTRDYSCARSNILIFGGNPDNINDGNGLPASDGARNIPDIHNWHKIVMNFERNIGTTYVDGNEQIRIISNPNLPQIQQDAVGERAISNMLGGIAYWARTHDIRGTGWTTNVNRQRPGLRVRTFIFSKDFNNGSLSDAPLRHSGIFFMAAKYGGFETDPVNPDRRPYNTHGNPFRDQDDHFNNDVWQKTSEPGEAGTFRYSDSTKVSPARGMLSALDDIFRNAAMHSVAGSSLNTGNQFTADSVRYSATFDVDNWRGDVVANPVSGASSHALKTEEPLWSAARQLELRSSTLVRNIFVGKPGLHSTAISLGSAAINDNFKTKIRNSPLGPIINSNVSYSAAPDKKPFATGAGYAAFRTEHASRTPTVFAGSNDGMLHAFKATTGDELFAYIPSWIGRKLSALIGLGLADRQSHVDGPMVVAEAQVGSTDTVATDWKTVLVSGTGGGGSGVFALDVSDPSNFGAANVMWEFTRTDDPDIGQVVGAPRIMKIKTSASNAAETYRWFAVVAGGVNNHLHDSTGYSVQPVSSHGNPALFLLALDKPAGSPWVRGSNYFKITVPHTASPQTDAPGLTNFSALYGIRGEMTDIYMGDLHGALWRLQFQGKATADWTMDKLSFFYQGTRKNPSAYPLYRARFRPANSASSEQVQPIFAAPTLFAGPRQGNVNTHYVMFGTGRYLEPADKFSTAMETVYTIYDNGAAHASADPAVTSIIPGRGWLQTATIDEHRNVTTPNFRWGHPVVNTDTTQRAGWYLDLPESGERVHHAALNLGSLSAAINSTIPDGRPPGTKSCRGVGGGNEYKLNIVDGTGSAVPSTGLPAAPVFMIDNTIVSVSPTNSAGQRTQTTRLRPLTQTQYGDNGNSTWVDIPRKMGRLGWRQIFNYRDLRLVP